MHKESASKAGHLKSYLNLSGTSVGWDNRKQQKAHFSTIDRTIAQLRKNAIKIENAL
jgi:hypothetical protein